LNQDLHRYLLETPLAQLLGEAAALRDAGHGRFQTWSPKVFLPLTHLCRNLCHYCTFSQPPRPGERCYMSREDVLAVARQGAAAGCSEALFTLGDKPELRFRAAAEELASLGHETTISYLIEMCRAVVEETGLLPHVNGGVMSRDEMAALREVSVSQGLMLESVSERLGEKGGAHYRSPDKAPAVRLAMLRQAGELAVPFTTGILIGIGERRAERIEALLAIRDAHAEFGHIQEVIVQNFRAKPRTVMADAPEPDLGELQWSIAAARLILGVEMNIQAPPNLTADGFGELIAAGINDWGGVSPVTPDFVNPEAPWPEVAQLRAATAAQGKALVARLPVYPAWSGGKWQALAMARKLPAQADSSGFARIERWSPGMALPIPRLAAPALAMADPAIASSIARAAQGERLDEAAISALFRARDIDVEAICEAANGLRRAVNGDTVSFVVNRNINYTNICTYRCQFCAFSKGDTAEDLRGRPYDLDLEEVTRRVREAHARGATEVCLQGGIHPRYTGATYLEFVRTVKAAVPGMHLHAFSPLEILQGARTLGWSLEDYLSELKTAGLGSLPGTAAEILDDEVRAVICPDKLSSGEWLDVVGTAHRVGLPTTATIMFGHVEREQHWARHLLRFRDLQEQTGGFTEFVPLPFVHMEAPIGRKELARHGPTFREVRLMHGVARLVFHGLIPNIQASWVKLGPDGAAACLDAGVNDLGGTLMNESISRAAGTTHGQELHPRAMEQLILAAGRVPQQRSTLYGPIAAADRARGLAAGELAPVVQTPPRKQAAREIATA
jgi:FO synthase